jgi:uncharacterized protein (TIGR00730 family)
MQVNASVDSVVEALRQVYLESGLVSPEDFSVAVTAFGELLEGAALFERHADSNKVAVFGSARTKPSHPLYQLAVEFSQMMSERDWLIISGAGPGIMEAASKGAGFERTLGVNIELPFEQFPNPYIDTANKLVEMNHFFTRKVAMTRPSNAFVVLPGGFGTLDEAFEVLTLLHTGKTEPAPVVLLDQPGGTFWRRLESFIQDEIIDGQYINKPDLALVKICDTAEGAVREITNFFKNYRDVRFAPGTAFITVHQLPTTEQLAILRNRFPMFATGSGFRTNGSDTLVFDFDGRNYVNLRLVIDFLNDLVP